jgi:hypothetical protein
MLGKPVIALCDLSKVKALLGELQLLHYGRLWTVSRLQLVPTA